jgi:FkbM family methyltransferase
MHDTTLLTMLIAALPTLKDFHAHTSAPYALLRRIAQSEIASTFQSEEGTPMPMGFFGELSFPYLKMGAIDSLDLFGLDELIIFSFYARNAKRYKKTLDMGANIGLHSILMSRCGFEVTCFEPDPKHFALLLDNLKRNQASSIKPVNAAVSIQDGTMEFVRVLGNTTGSHLAGAKSNLYGELERFPVRVLPFSELIHGIDFVKLDVEGHEKTILTSTTAAQWDKLDMMAEIGSEENARAVFEHLSNLQVNMFSQKLNWGRVTQLKDMPASYHDGSLFISSKPVMPWGDTVEGSQ